MSTHEEYTFGDYDDNLIDTENYSSVKKSANNVLGKMVVDGIAVTGMLAASIIVKASKEIASVLKNLAVEGNKCWKKKQAERYQKQCAYLNKINFEEIEQLKESLNSFKQNNTLSEFTNNDIFKSIDEEIKYNSINITGEKNLKKAYERKMRLDKIRKHLNNFEVSVRQKCLENFNLGNFQDKKRKAENVYKFLKENWNFLEKELKHVPGELKKTSHYIDRISDYIAENRHNDAIETAKNIDAIFTETRIINTLRHEIKVEIEKNIAIVDSMEADEFLKAWIGDKLEDTKATFKNYLEIYTNFSSLEIQNLYKVLEKIPEKLTKMEKEAKANQENEFARKMLIGVIQDFFRDKNFQETTDPFFKKDRKGPVLLSANRPGLTRKQHINIEIFLDGRMTMDVDGGDPNDIQRIEEAQVDLTLEKSVMCRKITDEITHCFYQKGLPLTKIRNHWHNPEKIAQTAKPNPNDCMEESENDNFKQKDS